MYNEVYTMDPEEQQKANIAQSIIFCEKYLGINSEDEALGWLMGMGQEPEETIHRKTRYNEPFTYQVQMLCEELDTPPDFSKSGKELHADMADYLRRAYTACKIDKVLYVRDAKGSAHTADESRIKGLMQALYRPIKESQKKETIHYLMNSLDVPSRQEAAPHIIPFKSYAYDIDTMTKVEYRKYAPDMVFTRQFPYDYKPNAPRASTVDDFLNAIACNDGEVVQLILEMFGYCFYRVNEYRGNVVFFDGKGSNGKSTLLNMLAQMIGERNTANLSLDDIAGENSRFRLAGIQGKSICLCDDISAKAVKDSSTLKRIALGGKVTGENKGEKPFDMTPTVKMFFNANEVPLFYDNSEGLTDRLTIIPMHADFRNAPDTKLKDKHWTTAEMEYLVKISLEAFIEMRKRGKFTKPKCVFDRETEFRKSIDHIKAFYNDFCERDANGVVNKFTFAVYEEYKAWCQEERIAERRIYSKSDFSKKICALHGNLKTEPRKYGAGVDSTSSERMFVIKDKQ